MHVDANANAAGFSLVEAAISIVIVALLITSVFSITVESTSLLGDVEVENIVQVDANRALASITDILRKSGRMEDQGVQYPRVVADGAELEFRIPDDLDGNGYAFDGTTAAIEWNANVFSIKLDRDGVLAVYRAGEEVSSIAHHVSRLRFETASENPTLHQKEISIQLETRSTLKTGHDVVFALMGSVHMRN